MPISATDLNKAYLAYFGRPADLTGKTYFATLEQADVIKAFDASAESKALYGNDAAAKVNAIYQNLFNRDAEPAGLVYWTTLINQGRVTAAGAAFAILNGAQGTDATAVQNKLAASEAFVAAMDTTAELVGYSGMDAAASARNWLKAVGADAASLTAAVAGAQAAVTAAVAAGTGEGGAGFQLTNGTDVASANVFTSGLVYTPGGDDRVNSLQDEDRLTGTGTNATLNATMGNANDNGAPIITPTLNNINTINAAFTGSGGTAVNGLDLQDATGLTTVNLTRVSQAINFAEVGNIQGALTNMSLKNTNSNQAGTVEFSFNGGALAGANTGTMALSNVNVRILNIGQNTSGIGAAGVANQGYENLTLQSNGSANVIGTLNLPMDTGTAGALVITGSQDLRLGGRANIVNNVNAALVEAAGLYTAGTGVAQAGGRIAAIDASALTGNLSIVLDNILDVGKADTSGVLQNVTVTGGSGNDTFALFDAIQAADSLNGGAGTDTLILNGTNNAVGANGSIASVAQSIETVSMLSDGIAMAADFDFLPDVTGVVVRNVGNVAGVNVTDAAVSFSLTDLTVAQAAGITVQHSTTGNNQITDTTIEAAIKANTAADTLGVTIAEGTNVDPRFNFTIDTVVANTATSTTAAASTFENITLTDSDTESNSVELQNFAQHTGTITLTGGLAGTFLNLDVDTAGTDVTNNINATTADTGQVQQGLLGIDTDGSGVDLTAGHFIDVGNLATQVRLGAATINASGEASNVYVRVGTNAASVTGAQSITMGSGNDVVIFDLINDARAGLTISDTVAGGQGTDKLVIDGHGVRVSLGASEWTNVTGFETIQLAGNQAAAVGTIVGQNSYNLVLTNELIAANGVSGMINIINDNDISNDAASGADTVTIAASAESGVTIDARSLNSTSHFSYNGEEGASNTVDKFIFTDANINGMNVIDGGAVNNVVLGAAVANTDVLEVRNTATVTAGDLANLRNIGIIAASNDQATAQTLTLELTDSVIDALVDSYHVSSTTEIETLNIRLNNGADITAPVAGVGLDLDVSLLTAKSAVTVGALTAAVDSFKIGKGLLTVGAGFTTTTDKIVLSVGALGLSLDADDIGVAIGTDTLVDGTSIETAVAAATAATTRLIIDDTGADLNIYWDADGNGAQAQVLLATFTGLAAYAAGDFVLVA